MDEEVDRLNRYVADLMADRRPAREPLPNERALRARQAAAVLSGARPVTGIPAGRFLTGLEGRIARLIRDLARLDPRHEHE